MKRVWIALLAALFVLSLVPAKRLIDTLSPPPGNLFDQQQHELEEKYWIRIEYETSADGAVIDEDSLNTLDLALQNPTPELVRFVSAHYQEKTGHPLTFRYVRSGSGGESAAESILAGFQVDTAVIELYLPSPENPVITTGENPISIVHEFGHALHLLYAEHYGGPKMREEWTAFNGGHGYNASNIAANPDDRVYVSGYAATLYEEDVAETIAHVFVRCRAGQGFISRLNEDSRLTGLGRKVAYIEQMLSSLKEAGGALQNYCRMYSAAPTVSYLGMTFSGDYLQFAGYPPPRYVLNAMLAELDKKADEVDWVSRIGGWLVRQPDGSELIIFPGGVWCEIAVPLENIVLTNTPTS